MARLPEGKTTVASTVLLLLVSVAFLCIGVIYPEVAVRGQYGPPPSTPIDTPAPTPAPTPVFTPPPPPPPVKFPTGITLPTDVTPTNMPSPFALDQLGRLTGETALQGIHLVNDNSFPQSTELKGPTDWINLYKQAGADCERLTPYLADLKEGTAMLSVKHPSNMGMVKTPFGEIAIAADGDVLVSYTNDVLRIFNLDGKGETVKVKLDKGPFAEPSADPTVSIAPGFELVSSVHKLTRADMKPSDHIARRNFKILHNGHMAISEFSVESLLQTSELIASMTQRATGLKEKRILGDMSKMAAVLNHLNGTAGYTAQAQAP